MTDPDFFATYDITRGKKLEMEP
jgi:hypothetical protein